MANPLSSLKSMLQPLLQKAGERLKPLKPLAQLAARPFRLLSGPLGHVRDMGEAGLKKALDLAGDAGGAVAEKGRSAAGAALVKARQRPLAAGLAGVGVVAALVLLIMLLIPEERPYEMRAEIVRTLETDPFPPWVEMRLRQQCRRLSTATDAEIRKALFSSQGEPLRLLMETAGVELFAARPETAADPLRLSLEHARLDYEQIREVCRIYMDVVIK